VGPLPLIDENYGALGLANVQYVDPRRGCGVPWEEIPSNSQDVVAPIMCPIYIAVLQPIEALSKEVLELLRNMIRVVKPHGSILVAFYAPYYDTGSMHIFANIMKELGPVRTKIWENPEECPFQIGYNLSESTGIVHIMKVSGGGRRQRSRRRRKTLKHRFTRKY
jgi:hypothetical protein